MVKSCSKLKSKNDNSFNPTAKIFLSLFLVSFLVIPVFADSYIIVPQDIIGPIEKVSVSMARNSVKTACNPIYGTNACSGEFTEEQVEKLKKTYNVYENHRFHISLINSVPQIDADDVWDVVVNGTNLTGKGQTVCIIDTGIDYNHSALGGAWGNKVLAGYRFLDNGTDVQECNATNHTACWDDNGHGTHCAGIVASDHSTYRGVAPDAKLVIVKSMDSGGGGWGSDITSGINYCVNHAEEYNISVISMSLGDDAYHNSNYCENYFPPFTAAINNAVAKNISVVVASGNEGKTNAISAPACIYNATPVGSVGSSDSIYYQSNKWSLPLLFAPGVLIRSTIPSDSWGYMTGTSMSTPHVAGVFALMNQYLELSGKVKTPQELEDIAIRTGKTLTGINNSRVNAYDFYLNLSGVGGKHLSSCTTIDEPGDYYLIKDIIDSTVPTCIEITADNVSLYCDGHMIDGVDSGYGIRSYKNNTLIHNCTITDWNHGIKYWKANRGHILNNRIFSNTGKGLFLGKSSSNYIAYNELYDNEIGLRLESSSNSNTVRDNKITFNDDGISITSDNNLIYNNYLNNTDDTYDKGTNFWNTTNQTGPNIVGGSYIGGNYYSDYVGVDANGDGFGEVPYNIAGGSNVDYLPLVIPLVSSNQTTITTEFFNITFDREHGGVVTNLQYKGVDFITGRDNGKWGTIGLRKSNWNGSTGGVCERWAVDMDYQYDQNHILTVDETPANYTVTISPNGTSNILGTDREIVWNIPKNLSVLTLKYQPGYENEYLYMPFIRNYNSQVGKLAYYTTSGTVTAEDLPYCESRWYQSSMVEYNLTAGSRLLRTQITPTELFYSAYYGNDTRTWQMHFPFDGLDSKKLSMVFSEVP